MEDTHVNGSTQLLSENKDVPSEVFKQSIRQFVQLIFPKKKIPEQEDALQKSASAQSQQSVNNQSHTDSTIAEAEEPVTIVGEILEKDVILQDDLCASKISQHREELQIPVSRGSYYHKPPCPAEQKRRPSHAARAHQATPKCQNCSVRQKQMRDQHSLKSTQFSKEGQCLRHPHLSPPSKTASPAVSPSPHGPAMPHISGHHPHCPRHCPLLGGVLSGQPGKYPPAFPIRKTHPQRKFSPYREK